MVAVQGCIIIVCHLLNVEAVYAGPEEAKKMMQRPNPSLQSHAHAPKLMFCLIRVQKSSLL